MHINGSMPNMMREYFIFSDHVNNFLFKDLNISNPAGIVGVCLIMCCLTILLEATKTLSVLFHSRMKQHPLTYGQTHLQDRSPLFRHLVIPSNIEQIRRRRIRYHLLGYLSHVFNLALGYFIMLAVMTYDTWVLIAVISGSGIGYFIFGACTTMIQARFSALQNVQYDNDDENSTMTQSIDT